MIEVFQYLIPFSVLLTVLVFIHELGHFLVARYYGVTVEVFSIGFGPKILKYKKGDTIYCLSLIPLGGYVKMFGDNPKQVIEGEDRKRAFLCQKVWPKIAIALGGPLMNFFLAILIFMVTGFIGHQKVKSYLGDIQKNSQAYEVGFRSGDKILSIDDQKVIYWDQVQKIISNSGLKSLSLLIDRDGVQKKITTKIQQRENNHVMSLKKYTGFLDGLTFISRSAHIGIKDHRSLAYKSGLRKFDKVLAVNSISVNNWRDFEKQFDITRLSSKSQLLHLKVERDGKILSFHVPVRKRSSLRQIGIEGTSLYVDRVKKGSPAAVAGVLAQDRLFSVNGKKKLKDWDSFAKSIQNIKSSPINLAIIRDSKKKILSITPELMSVFDSDGQIKYKKMVGIASAQHFSTPLLQFQRILNPAKAFVYGVKETLRWAAVTVKVVYKLLTGSMSRRMLGGPLSIAKAAKQSISNSFNQFLKVMAIISVNLFIMNLLPIPVLDGGHLLLFTIEGIKGKPLSVDKIEKLQMFGFFLLLFFIALTIFNDIQNWNLMW